MKTNRKVVQQVIALAFGLLAIVGPIQSMARGGRGGGGRGGGGAARGASFHGGGGAYRGGVSYRGGGYRGGGYRGGYTGVNRSAAFTGYRGGYRGGYGYGNRGYYNRGFYGRGYYGNGYHNHYHRYYRPGFGLGYAAGLYGGYGGYGGYYNDNYYDQGYYQPSAGYTAPEQPVTEQQVMQQPVMEQQVMQQPMTEQPVMGQPQQGIAQLAPGYETVNMEGTMYYFSCGAFWVNENGTFREVAPPAGALVYNLPAGATQEEINGVGYVVYNNILFTPMTYNGRDAYQVIRSR